MFNRYFSTIVAAVLAKCIGFALMFPVATAAVQAADLGPFDAVYFDRTVDNPHKIRETVPDIAIKFGGGAGFPNIKPRNFAASWNGFLTFDKPVTKLIQVSQSWAKTRIKIDGAIVFEGGSNAEFKHAFAHGQHYVEVFYINNWHAVQFKVTIQDEFQLFTTSELAAHFASMERRPRELVYFGLYGSRSKDTSVNLELAAQHEGSIVWLDSYEAIDWVFKTNPGIRAVVIAARKPGSRVIGLDDGIPVFRTREALSVRSKPKARCRCTVSAFRCDYRIGWTKLEDNLFERTGAQITAFATKNSAKSLHPQAFDQVMRKTIALEAQKAKKVEAACKKRRNADFDTLFGTK